MLDGLRGLAILLVLCNHFGPIVPMSRWDAAFQAFVAFGWSGVNLFFVLSGFLITGILIDSRDAPHYFRNFYARRTLRIFPLYYGTLVCLAVGLRLLRQPQAEHFGWYWMYASNIVQTVTWRPTGCTDPAVFSHFWSLAVEEHFYLVWPLLMYVAGRRGRYLIGVAVLAAGPLCRALSWKFTHNPMGAYVLTPCRTDALALGGLLAMAVRDPAVYDLLSRHRRRIVPVGMVVVGLLAAVFAWSGDTWWYRRHTEVAGFTLIDFLAALSILGLLQLRADHPVSRGLSAPWLRSMGKYSYGIYVLHDIVGPPVLKPIMHRLSATWPLGHCPSAVPASLVAILLGTGITYGAAWVSFHGFERHFLKLKSRFESPQPAAAVISNFRPLRPAPPRAVGPALAARPSAVAVTVRTWPRRSSATPSTT